MKINYSLGRRQGIPWLYYQNSPDKVINNTDIFQFEVSFDPKDSVNVNKLKFYLVTFDIEGNFIGMELLKNQLEFCSNTYEDGTQFSSFGTTIENNCNIDLSKYMNRNSTMYFYELYLYDPINKNLVDVPVLVDNISNRNSTAINSLNNSTDPANWILTRRFFLIDNVSGIQDAGGYKSKKSLPVAIRFAKTIKLRIGLQSTSQSRIYVPFLEIFYKAKSSNMINSTPQTFVSFASEYSMDIKSFMNAMLGIFIAINVIVIGWVVLRLYIWRKLNPSQLSPDNYGLWFTWTIFMQLFKTWSMFIFWFCLAITAYWFVFFKLQFRVFILLPPLNTYLLYYKPFDIIFGLGCASYTVYMCYLIYQQVNIDIFFIDWEHEKEILVKNASELRTEKYRGAWRILYVANQFNELQKHRNISLPFSFCILIFMWYYLDWGLQSHSIPSLTVAPNSPENYLLRYFLGGFIMVLCGLGHIIYVKIFQCITPQKKQDFVDLCSVSNVSVFILDQSLHGYYIHGQSPSGKADTNMDELLNFLEEEGAGKVKGRGLMDKDQTNLQSFEIFISYNMRTIYDGIYGLQAETMILTAQNRDRLSNQSRIANFLKALPKSLKLDKIYKLKSYMNSELKEKVQKVSNQASTYIRDKTKLQRFLDYPPFDLISQSAEDIMFFKDPNMNFEDVLTSGIEWQWFIWDVYVYLMWMLVLHNCALAVFLTFISDRILLFIRSLLGEKNLARKAIIDNKFFI